MRMRFIPALNLICLCSTLRQLVPIYVFVTLLKQYRHDSKLILSATNSLTRACGFLKMNRIVSLDIYDLVLA